MTNIVTIENVRGYCDENGTAYLNAEDVARGLGFVDYQEKDSATGGRKTYEVIRWARVNGYLREFGYPTEIRTGDFLPENMVYRLAMKANNEVAQNFQAQLADVILPTIRRTGSYSVKPAVDTAHSQIVTLKTAINDIGDVAESLRNVFGVAQGMALAKATTLIEATYKLDLTEIKTLIAPVEDAGTLTATAIAKLLGMKSGQAVNNALCDLGLAERTDNGLILTDEGKKYAEQIPFAATNGHCGYQIKWNHNVLPFLQ